MIRFLVCVVLGGVAALFVHASVHSFLVGLVVGFFLGWLPMKMAPGCDTDQKRNQWCWFVVQCTVLVAVAMFVVFRPDHGWISMPSFVLRPSQKLQQACHSNTGGLEDPNWVQGSTQELGTCSGAAVSGLLAVLGRVLWAIAAGLRLANVAFAIFLAWLITQLPPLRQVRRRLVT